MTRDEFAAEYARRSGVTVEMLFEWGREPRPCDCDWSECEGWQMAYPREETIVLARLLALELREAERLVPHG